MNIREIRRQKVQQQTSVGGHWDVVNFEGYLYQGWNCIMCVRFNNDETFSTPPTVQGRVASFVGVAGFEAENGGTPDGTNLESHFWETTR